MNEKLILIIEDEKKIIEVIHSYLNKSGYKAFYALTGKDAIELFRLHKFSLVILDLMLPDIPGEEICIRLRKISRVPIIILTAKTEEIDKLYGFKIGADDYIEKPFSPKELLARIDAIFRRSSNEFKPVGNYFSFYKDELVIDNIKRQVKVKGKIINLTPDEYKILITLISYPQKVFSRDEIITHALGNDYTGFDRIIDTHIKNLRKKLEPDPENPKYIFTIYGSGYCFKGEYDQT
ncbi:MAG: response regulator transcription factor [Spirochaetes bacterium]|nr:response regulator transcription factor [Spirochaetota bacterium]